MKIDPLSRYITCGQILLWLTCCVCLGPYQDASSFCLFPANRDLIRKLLVVDRTRRLGNMKVSVRFHMYHPLDTPVTWHHTFPLIETKARRSCLIVGYISNLVVWACEIHLGLYRIPSSLQTSKRLTHHLEDVGILLIYFDCSNNMIDL